MPVEFWGSTGIFVFCVFTFSRFHAFGFPHLLLVFTKYRGVVLYAECDGGEAGG
jgi:hypothetical protein